MATKFSTQFRTGASGKFISKTARGKELKKLQTPGCTYTGVGISEKSHATSLKNAPRCAFSRASRFGPTKASRPGTSSGPGPSRYNIRKGERMLSTQRSLTTGALSRITRDKWAAMGEKGLTTPGPGGSWKDGADKLAHRSPPRFSFRKGADPLKLKMHRGRKKDTADDDAPARPSTVPSGALGRGFDGGSKRYVLTSAPRATFGRGRRFEKAPQRRKGGKGSDSGVQYSSIGAQVQSNKKPPRTFTFGAR